MDQDQLPAANSTKQAKKAAPKAAKAAKQVPLGSVDCAWQLIQ